MSSPRPTATIVPKPISTTAEATTTETIQIDDEPTKKDKAPELPPTTRVEQDLELSQDSEEELHGVVSSMSRMNHQFSASLT